MKNQVNVMQMVEDLKFRLEEERKSLSTSPNPEYFEGKIQALKDVIEYLSGEIID